LLAFSATSLDTEAPAGFVGAPEPERRDDSGYHPHVMSLDDFRPPTTPESRMHRAVLVLFLIGGIRAAVGAFVGWRYSVETAIGVLVAATAYAVWRYLRQPHDPPTRRIF
jgi:hypothetical protein